MNNIIDLLETTNKIKKSTHKRIDPLNYTSRVEMYRPLDIVRLDNSDDYVKSLGL